MKNRFRNIIIAALLTIATCFQFTAFGQTTKEITIPAGKTSIVIRGRGNQSYTFHFNANPNYKIQLISLKNVARLEVLGDGGEELTEGSDGHSFEGSFGVAGDYQINVISKTAFTLKIMITRP